MSSRFARKSSDLPFVPGGSSRPSKAAVRKNKTRNGTEAICRALHELAADNVIQMPIAELWGELPSPDAPLGITGRQSTAAPSEKRQNLDARALIDCADVTIFSGPSGGEPTLKWVVSHYLGMDSADFVNCTGWYRKYRQSAMWGNIRIAWDGVSPGMGVHINIQGEACRQLENWSDFCGWMEFITRVRSKGGQFARLDLAVDDRAVTSAEGMLDMDVIQSCFLTVKGIRCADGIGGERKVTRVRLRFNSGKPLNDHYLSSGEYKGRGAYFGTRTSDAMARIYCKDIQKGLNTHYIRAELELRNSNADMAADLVLAYGIGYAACGIFAAYINFVDVNPSESNYARWPVCDWWREFLGSCSKLPLSTAPVSVSLEKSMQHLDIVAGPTLASAFEVLGRDWSLLWDWFVGCVTRAEGRLKPKHHARIVAFRALNPNWSAALSEGLIQKGAWWGAIDHELETVIAARQAKIRPRFEAIPA